MAIFNVIKSLIVSLLTSVGILPVKKEAERVAKQGYISINTIRGLSQTLNFVKNNPGDSAAFNHLTYLVYGLFSHFHQIGFVVYGDNGPEYRSYAVNGQELRAFQKRISPTLVSLLDAFKARETEDYRKNLIAATENILAEL